MFPSVKFCLWQILSLSLFLFFGGGGVCFFLNLFIFAELRILDWWLFSFSTFKIWFYWCGVPYLLLGSLLCLQPLFPYKIICLFVCLQDFSLWLYVWDFFLRYFTWYFLGFLNPCVGDFYRFGKILTHHLFMYSLYPSVSALLNLWPNAWTSQRTPFIYYPLFSVILFFFSFPYCIPGPLFCCVLSVTNASYSFLVTILF